MSDTKRRLRPSPSIIISVFALVIAMSAGAYAVTIAPKNSVVSKSIKNKNVKAADIKPKAVKKKHLGKNSVDSSKISDGQVGTADIGDGQVGTNDIGDGQVGLDDLSTAAKSDLGDAATLGGLTVAQIVAASGGEYYEGNQAGGNISLEVVSGSPVNVAQINLPHAGKYLINARMPVFCTYDGSDGPSPNDPAPQQPFFYAQGQLVQGATVLESEQASCEAEAGFAVILAGVFQGTTVVELTRTVTVTGPTTLTLRGSSVPSIVLATPVVAGARINANAVGSKIQAITVQ